MKRKFLEDLGLTKEQVDSIMEINGNDIENAKGNLTELTTQLETLNATVKERDKQIKDLGKSSGDLEALRKQITDLTTANATAMQEKEAEIKMIKTESAIENALKAAGAKNLKSVKALLNDLDKAEFTDDGSIKDLDKQIKALQDSEDTKFLFETKATQTKTVIAGATPATKTTSVDAGATQQSLKEAISAKIFAKNTQE